MLTSDKIEEIPKNLVTFVSVWLKIDISLHLEALNNMMKILSHAQYSIDLVMNLNTRANKTHQLSLCIETTRKSHHEIE